jgi:hypothetical protein
MTTTAKHASATHPIFETDLTRLKRHWKSHAHAPSSYFRKLRSKFEQLAAGEDAKRWYLPHAILLGLIDGSPAAHAQAKEDFLLEWSHGQQLNRGGLGQGEHYWNSLKFRTGDRWICAAMLAQLLILWDWLAAAGVWSQPEIDAAATEALDVAEAYLEPHLKGRGHMPFLPDPINQTAACITGLLYVGYMFGMKWRNQERAKRMYAFARNLVPDAIGQYPANGYDDDGFTYIRHIHLQVHTLSIALLEEVEGGDWYHRKFAPHHHSLSDLNALQLDFVTPSGFAWPLGRYGYIKSWNLFNQSFAARRSGDPRYLQVARRDNEGYDYKSPWLGMDLPLGLLWYPHELEERVRGELPPTPQKRRVAEDSWAVFTQDRDRMLAVAVWMRGKAPHFFLEAHGSPLILGGSEMWPTSNGVQCDPQKWGMKSWLNPGGELRLYCDIPGFQAVYFNSARTYPPVVEVEQATRVFVNCEAGLVISDRFSSRSAAPAVWQASTWLNPKLEGTVATVKAPSGVTLRAISAEQQWTFRPTPERKPRHEGIGAIDLGMLELAGQPGHGSFDVLLDWQQEASDGALRRTREDLLVIEEAARGAGSLILLPGESGPRALGPYQTDAMLAILDTNRQASFAAARAVQQGRIERIWSSLPVDVSFTDDAYWVSGLKYGEFVTLRSGTHFVCLRIGNGIELWGRSPDRLRVHLRHPSVAVQLNGRPAEVLTEDGWTIIDIPDTTSAAKSAGEALATAVANGATAAILRALHDIQQAMAWEYAAEVRKLFKWDASPEPTLPKLELKTEATYVRLEAAATAMSFGDRDAIPELIELLLREAHHNYAPEGGGNGKWWGFPTRSVTLEALMVLHATQVLKVLDEVLALEVWPHGIDAVARTRAVLA